MERTLSCACGEQFAAETDEELLACVEAHVFRVHSTAGEPAANAPAGAEEE
jgi:hypothetical protein